MDMSTHGLLPKVNQDPTRDNFSAHPSFGCTLRKKRGGSFQCMCRCLTQHQHSQWLGWIDSHISNFDSPLGGTRERKVSRWVGNVEVVDRVLPSGHSCFEWSFCLFPHLGVSIDVPSLVTSVFTCMAFVEGSDVSGIHWISYRFVSTCRIDRRAFRWAAFGWVYLSSLSYGWSRDGDVGEHPGWLDATCLSVDRGGERILRTVEGGTHGRVS